MHPHPRVVHDAVHYRQTLHDGAQLPEFCEVDAVGLHTDSEKLCSYKYKI